jgi:predicted nucleic acid-binding protein
MGVVFDTYALLAWFRDGNEGYRRFFESDEDKFITLLILMEFYFFLYHFSGKRIADEYSEILRRNFKLLRLSATSAVDAAVMRSHMVKQKRRMSYTDCIGYALALQHHHKFLTGDQQFMGLKHVIFVK